MNHCNLHSLTGACALRGSKSGGAQLLLSKQIKISAKKVIGHSTNCQQCSIRFIPCWLWRSDLEISLVFKIPSLMQHP